jgi:hypothetical protein
MDASGTTREGWMTFIPVTVLLFIVIYVVGGPAHFMNVVAQWSMDLVHYVGSWIKYL